VGIRSPAQAALPIENVAMDTIPTATGNQSMSALKIINMGRLVRETHVTTYAKRNATNIRSANGTAPIVARGNARTNTRVSDLI